MPSVAAVATTIWWPPWVDLDTPGVGFALGIDRILLAAQSEVMAGRLQTKRRLDAFVVDFAGGDAGRDLTARLRAAGLRADRGFDARSTEGAVQGRRPLRGPTGPGRRSR